MHVTINPETCDFSVYAEREVKEFVDDPALEISLVDAQKINTNAELGDMIKVEIHSKEFGRIATQNAKNVILQKIREEDVKSFMISIMEWKRSCHRYRTACNGQKCQCKSWQGRRYLE